ncbi:MAG: NifU family protein [Candidatus Ryanbacteria bacterium]|nr:NifU family protein [Candidatus Ryanbacteria bacterium]
MESEIKKVLKEQVSPMLAFHQGDAEFVSYQDGIVNLRLKGTCKGCPLAALTLKEGIEMILKENFNGIERVEAVE